MSISTRARSVADTVALWTIAVVAALFFLREARSLLIPIVLAVLISYALEPVVAWLVDRRLPRMLATILVMGTVLGLAGSGAYALRDEAQQAIQSLPEVARKVREVVTSGSGATAPIGQAVTEMQKTGAPSQESERPSGSSPQPATDSMNLSSWLQRGVSSVFSLVGNLAVIVFLVFFILISGHQVRNRIVEISGPDADRRKTARKILDDIDAQLQRFLLVRVAAASRQGGR